MKRLGVIENVAYDGSILVRSMFAPTPGTPVYDKRNHALGTVARVFGPVREPFATVRPDGKVPLSALGSNVFVKEGNDAKPKGRRGGRSH